MRSAGKNGNSVRTALQEEQSGGTGRGEPGTEGDEIADERRTKGANGTAKTEPTTGPDPVSPPPLPDGGEDRGLTPLPPSAGGGGRRGARRCGRARSAR